MVEGPPTEGENESKVKRILRDGKWVLSEASLTLLEWVQQRIESIPIPTMGVDTWVCPFASARHFNAKDLYYALWKERTKSTPDKKWEEAWKAKVPPKIKVFLWFILWNSLPTNFVLNCRGMDVNRGCPQCQHSDETWHHIMRDCC